MISARDLLARCRAKAPAEARRWCVAYALAAPAVFLTSGLVAPLLEATGHAPVILAVFGIALASQAAGAIVARQRDRAESRMLFDLTSVAGVASGTLLVALLLVAAHDSQAAIERWDG